jgi:hypothetical protein
MTTPTQQGWYDDPTDPKAQRYWDGQSWTPHRQRKPVSQPAPVSVPRPLPAPPAAPLPPPPPTGSPLPPPPFGGLPPDQPLLLPPDLTSAPRRSRTPLLIGALAGVVVLVVAAAVGFYVFIYNSDEHQINAVTQDFVKTYNNGDGDGMAKLLCSQALGTPKGTSGFLLGVAGVAMSSELQKQLDELGAISMSVSDIHVTGDRATASVTTAYSKAPADKQTETDPYVKENGSWKVCPADG